MTQSEAQTRVEIIDQNLKLAGWNVNDPSQVMQELDIILQDHPVAAESASPYAGHRFADYALLLRGKPVAVIEAKKTSRDAELGREQALQYAQLIQKKEGGALPFVFYTNGYDNYFWDSEFYPPHKVYGFPSREDLEWMVQKRETRKPLSVELINTSIAGRGYQIAAIRQILEQFEAKRRRLLLVMATGTGKTRTAVALVDVLMRARWAKRVLFLVDRIPLQEQALDAFKEYLPSEPRWPQEGTKETFVGSRRIYVTTYPTMLNLIENGGKEGPWISPNTFDLVIADESHRSLYNTYKSVLDYFNAVKLGLTATPKDHVDHDTFKLFECDSHDPTFAYTYEEALEHQPPYLCPFEVLKVRSKFQLEGIKGGTLPQTVQKQLVAEGKDVEEIDFEGTDLERKVTNSGTNALIVREFMEESIKDSSGTLPGKSIFFAISKAHARRLEELFNHLYPEYQGRLARVLVSEDSRVHGKGGLLDQFKHQDMPRVAISVDMLDTGVDVPEVVNLVFAKPVYSYVKFWQMIGRGTRVLNSDIHKRKPWCTEKDKFLIIDCWANFEFFKMHPKGKEPDQQESLPVKLFRARLDKLEAAISVQDFETLESAKKGIREDLEKLPKNNVIVSEGKADLASLDGEEYWKSLTANQLGYLRSNIAPLLRARSDADFKAMRFEADVVELGTALLTGEPDRKEAVKQSILSQVEELPLTLSMVSKEKELIDNVQREKWWVTTSQKDLDYLSEHLSPLMNKRQKRRDPFMTLDLEDLRVIKEWVEFGPEHERVSSSAYRDRVEKLVLDMVDRNPILKKIRSGQEVSETEITELSKELEAGELHVTENLLRKTYSNKNGHFIQFMKHILGLEKLVSWPETISLAFEKFIANHNNFNSAQLRFLETLRTFLLQTGTIEKQDLVAEPFTRLHPDGIRGLFKESEIDEILIFTEKLTA